MFLYFSVYRFCTSFGKFILEYFIFDAIVNKIVLNFIFGLFANIY